MDLKTAAEEVLRVSEEDGARVDALNRAAVEMQKEGKLVPSVFEVFSRQGIRVDAIRGPGRILCCSFTVPACHTAGGNQLSPGAVVALVDQIGVAVVVVVDGKHYKVSVDMSVSFVDLAAAASGDVLRITARALGHKGYYSGTHVLIANAATGKVVAEGRHSLFGKMKLPPSIKSNI